MAPPYDIEDLKYWDRRVREQVEAFGLSCAPQEFELCDHAQMLAYSAYHGMPSHYPHWSFGKAYERLKTRYDHGVAGLPYEMVINADPCIAYLMRENSLCLQILTMAHVYGHNDFFRNNHLFRHTRAETVVPSFKLHADRVRGYIADPSIGLEQVEAMLDAAHALSLQCRRNPMIRKLSRDEQRQRAIAAARPPADPYHRIHKPAQAVEPDLTRVPLEPEEDVLLFIRDHNPILGEWEKDLLTIVHEEAQYFMPQMETKIMNEGWASYWHQQIMRSLDLPQDVYLEFLVRHNQVVRPIQGEINPYYLGFKVWEDLRRRYDEPTAAEIEANGPPDKSGREKMFEVREVDRDVSFLRRFLSEDLVREQGLFEYAAEGDALVVTKVATTDDWQAIKDTLLRSVGTGDIPVIRIEDADHGRTRAMYLRHEHDGRDLQLDYAGKTLGHIYRLWGRRVVLRTVVDEQSCLLSFDDDGFRVEERF
jgi:stage V sporulation protein R